MAEFTRRFGICTFVGSNMSDRSFRNDEDGRLRGLDCTLAETSFIADTLSLRGHEI